MEHRQWNTKPWQWQCHGGGNGSAAALMMLLQDGVEVIHKMCNIRNLPTVVFDTRDSQLHQDYTIDSDKRALLSESKFERMATVLQPSEV